MSIAHQHIPYTYQESKRVFENDLTIKEATENINKQCAIKVTSAKDYVYYFKYLMTGEGSCRILNKFTQRYYLEKIFQDYGIEQKQKSLKNFKKLIDKFEGEKVGSKKSMNLIYDEFLKLV